MLHMRVYGICAGQSINHPIQVKQENRTVIIFLCDRSNLLEMKNALEFQHSVCSPRVNCESGGLSGRMGEANKNTAGSHAAGKNTAYLTGCLTEQIHYICLHTSR